MGRKESTLKILGNLFHPAHKVRSTSSSGERKYAEYIENSSLQMQNYVLTLIEVTRSGQGCQFHPEITDCSIFFGEMEQQTRGLCMINIQKHNGQLILENAGEMGGAKVTIKLPC